MRAGAMRDRVTVQKRLAPSGQYVKAAPAWSTVVADRSATITPLRGNETVIAERLQGREIYSITMRTESALDELDASWRLVETDGLSPASVTKIYNIRHVARPGRLRDKIIMTCVAGETDDGG